MDLYIYWADKILTYKGMDIKMLIEVILAKMVRESNSSWKEGSCDAAVLH